MVHQARELATIQALRAAACWLVIGYHARGGAWDNGAAGVDLFFVISGLVMGVSSVGLAARSDGWRVFAGRRLRRLVPLYWGLTAAKLGIGLAVPATLLAARPGWWNILASFLFVPARNGAGLVRPVLGVGWTLQFEMLFYASFATALALRRPPARLVTVMLLPLAAAGLARQPDWPAPFSLANGLVLEFCMGLALARPMPALSRLPPAAGWLLLSAGTLLLLDLPAAGVWRFAAWGLPATCIVGGALALEPACGRHVPHWLRRVGDASYAIYLLHPFLMPALAHLLPTARVPGSGGILVAVSLPVCTLAGLVLDRWVDKPVQAWLRPPARAEARRAVAERGAGSALPPQPSAQLIEL